MLRQRMQHVIEEANARAHGDLLGSGELGRMGGILDRNDALFGSLCVLGVFGEMLRGLEGRKNPAVQGERDLDLGLVGDAGQGRGSSGERHFGGSGSIVRIDRV